MQTVISVVDSLSSCYAQYRNKNFYFNELLWWIFIVMMNLPAEGACKAKQKHSTEENQKQINIIPCNDSKKKKRRLKHLFSITFKY